MKISGGVWVDTAEADSLSRSMYVDSTAVSAPLQFSSGYAPREIQLVIAHVYFVWYVEPFLSYPVSPKYFNQGNSN